MRIEAYVVRGSRLRSHYTYLPECPHMCFYYMLCYNIEWKWGVLRTQVILVFFVATCCTLGYGGAWVMSKASLLTHFCVALIRGSLWWGEVEGRCVGGNQVDNTKVRGHLSRVSENKRMTFIYADINKDVKRVFYLGKFFSNIQGLF